MSEQRDIDAIPHRATVCDDAGHVIWSGEVTATAVKANGDVRWSVMDR